MPRIELERFEQDVEDDRDAGGHDSFDRLAFAQRLLALVRPSAMTVAICEGRRHLTLDSGRRWGGAPGERWALLSIPPTASRRAIAGAVLRLVAEDGGRLCAPTGHPYRAWSLDVLMSACE